MNPRLLDSTWITTLCNIGSSVYAMAKRQDCIDVRITFLELRVLMLV